MFFGFTTPVRSPHSCFVRSAYATALRGERKHPPDIRANLDALLGECRVSGDQVLGKIGRYHRGNTARHRRGARTNGCRVTDKQFSPPVAGSAHVNASAAALVVPPRPDLPDAGSRTAPSVVGGQPLVPPPLPPGWRVPAPRAATSAEERARPTPWHSALGARLAEPRVLLGIYVIALTLIALWPTPVDAGARPLLRGLSRFVPMLTYARIEFAANILLFIPLGVLLAMILRQRYAIVPIAFVATVTIESIQALMIDKRVPSVMDIIANLAGACIGLLIVVAVEWRRGGVRRDPSAGARQTIAAHDQAASQEPSHGILQAPPPQASGDAVCRDREALSESPGVASGDAALQAPEDGVIGRRDLHERCQLRGTLSPAGLEVRDGPSAREALPQVGVESSGVMMGGEGTLIEDRAGVEGEQTDAEIEVLVVFESLRRLDRFRPEVELSGQTDVPAPQRAEDRGRIAASPALDLSAVVAGVQVRRCVVVTSSGRQRDGHVPLENHVIVRRMEVAVALHQTHRRLDIIIHRQDDLARGGTEPRDARESQARIRLEFDHAGDRIVERQTGPPVRVRPVEHDDDLIRSLAAVPLHQRTEPLHTAV